MATAVFVKTDITTLGSWSGVYGADGYSMASGPLSLPSYANLSIAGDSVYIWAPSSTDPRALVDGSARLAACWFSLTSFTMSLNLTDGNTHQVALYAVNWDALPRPQTFTITDAVTGAVLSTETLSTYSDGVWLVWNISGNVVITVANTGSPNSVVSGIFFSPVSTTSTPPPTTQTSENYMVVMVTTPPAPSHSAVLAWQPVVSATGYNVYRGVVSGGPYTKLTATPLASPSYVDIAVIAGTKYYYTTTSIVGGVESGYSTQVPVTIPTP